MKAEIYKTKNDLLDIKSELIKNQFSNLNSTSSVALNNDIRFMVEHLNNMTIEKQILATNKLSQQIDKLHFEIEKVRAEGKQSNLSMLKELHPNSTNDNSNLKFLEILLVIILAGFFVLGVFKVLKYFENNYDRKSRIITNQSQNTLNTTYDNSNL